MAKIAKTHEGRRGGAGGPRTFLPQSTSLLRRPWRAGREGKEERRGGRRGGPGRARPGQAGPGLRVMAALPRLPPPQPPFPSGGAAASPQRDAPQRQPHKGGGQAGGGSSGTRRLRSLFFPPPRQEEPGGGARSAGLEGRGKSRFSGCPPAAPWGGRVARPGAPSSWRAFMQRQLPRHTARFVWPKGGAD